MLTFPRGTLARAKAMVLAAPLPTQERVANLLKEDYLIEAQRLARTAELEAIDEEIAAINLQLSQILREEARYGHPESKTVTTINADGSTSVSTVATGSADKARAELVGLKARRRELTDRKAKLLWGRRALERLADYRGDLVADESEIALDQRDGETRALAHRRKWGEVVGLSREVITKKTAQIPACEAVALLHRAIDAMARPPGLDGFVRGSHTTARGKLAYGPSPLAEPAWPTRLIVPQVDPPDVIAILAWLLPDQLKARAERELLEHFDSADAVPFATKQTEIPELESRLWQARRELELLTIKAFSEGITNLNRPADTPTEILLNVRPFGETRGLLYDPPEPDFENDFEDGGDE